MAAPPVASPSTSRRPRESQHAEVDIGSFRRMEEIGRGSFATVYKAMHTKKGGYVAIKSVNLSKLNKKLKDNLFSEIHILKELHHPHIVSLLDCRESPTHIHLVMEYCQLGDLSYFIKKRDALARNPHTAEMIKKYSNPPVGGLNEVVVRHFLQQLASALEFLRNKNLIHRDVKPQNLLIIPSPLYYAKTKPEIMPYVPSENSLIPVVGIESLPMLKIADFGFARSLPSTSLAETLCGSPLYMAPEILRYEKYDAKADLWSVGTVTYEMMTGRPPFRASNHVELLRKIERGEDRIKFPEEVVISDAMKKMVRGLLKRNPVERMGFGDFFDNTVIKDDIPGLVGADRPQEQIEEQPARPIAEPMARQGSGFRNSPASGSDPRTKRDAVVQRRSSMQSPSANQENVSSRQPAIRPTYTQDKNSPHESDTTEHFVDAPEVPIARRPSVVSYATAPARPDAHGVSAQRIAGQTVRRRSSREAPSLTPSAPKDSNQARERVDRRSIDRGIRESREAQERAAQDVAFERDYVVLDKQAVEVNALADMLAARMQIAGPETQAVSQSHKSTPQDAMIRRATAQGTSAPTSGTQVATSRAMQIASGKRPDHLRQGSYERRLRSATSTSSAISKAINLASGRLFSFGVSPPLGYGRGGPSPPLYSAFPAYPTTQGSLLMIGDTSKPSAPLDEDAKAIQVIEESATRSDVVYGFAEVKYKQLIPLAPSMDHGLGLREAGIPEKDETVGEEENGLTVDAIVTLSEEALVLYVKALSLLAQSMDIAGAWWSRKSRGEVIEEDSPSPKTQASPAQNAVAGNRINNVVQWVRSRFNEVLEKAEFVRLKLIEAQNRLPPTHPSHPSNHPSASTSTGRMGTSAENVVVSSGVSAEKLMYLRAVEMSRSAAVNELVCEDLPGCEIAYLTAIRMLEAVLEYDDEPAFRKVAALDKDQLGAKSSSNDFNPVNPDDRESVLKMIQGIRGRLTALRKKLQMMAKRNNPPPSAPAPAKAQVATAPAQVPTIAGSSPR